jgi:hypothetical protein
MRKYYALLFSLIAISGAKAQRIVPSGGLNFQEKRIVSLNYSERQQPFIPRNADYKGTALVHVLDQEMKPYSGYLFRLEYKDFTTNTWKIYQHYQDTIHYNGGSKRVMPLIHQLPNGYYRAWAQCLTTQTVGMVPFELDVVDEEEGKIPLQVSLIIPQKQGAGPETLKGKNRMANAPKKEAKKHPQAPQ